MKPRLKWTEHRWAAFVLVGALGVALQVGVLELLTVLAGWHDLIATVVAVETAVIHNFLWHQRWTWVDRPVRTRGEVVGRLVRFNLTTGLMSIAGNGALMMLYTGPAGLSRVPANLLAVGTMSLLNFLAADRWVFSSLRAPGRGAALQASKTCAALACALFLAPAAVIAADGPSAETIAAWNRYVELTENRLTQAQTTTTSKQEEHLDGDGPLVIRQKDVSTAMMTTTDEAGRDIVIPYGAIHHWQGVVFVPGVDLDHVLDAAKHPVRQPGVLDVRVLDRSDDRLRLYLKLSQHRVVTLTYDTEHDVRFVRLSRNLASCSSVATRIVEVNRSGSDDHGFLWRLNAYWLYRQVVGGVVIELESLTLSRDLPPLVGPLIRPMVNRIARESMAQTLEAFRKRLIGEGSSGTIGASRPASTDFKAEKDIRASEHDKSATEGRQDRHRHPDSTDRLDRAGADLRRGGLRLRMD